MNKFKGTIVQESLVDDRVLNDFKIVKFRVTDAEKPEDRWHLFTFNADEKQIEKLSKQLKYAWYAHFWQPNHNDMIVIFQNKLFRIKYKDKSTWKEAVEYGKSMNIPDEQLDFLIEE
jgi:hypothetical protein